MKSFKNYIEESIFDPSFKKDKRIARLIRNFQKKSGMVKPGENPREVAIKNIENPKFTGSEIGKAIIRATQSKARRNLNLAAKYNPGINSNPTQRFVNRMIDSEPSNRARSDRRIIQKHSGRSEKLMGKGQAPDLEIYDRMLMKDLESRN